MWMDSLSRFWILVIRLLFFTEGRDRSYEISEQFLDVDLCHGKSWAQGGMRLNQFISTHG